MTSLYILITIVQTLSISVGLGSATIALFNFLAAIRDNLIDESERYLLATTNSIVKVSLALLVLTTLLQAILVYAVVGIEYFTPLSLSAWTVIVVLMLIRTQFVTQLLPNSFGPALAVGCWYTLGILIALINVRVTDFSYWQFLVGFVAVVALSISITHAIIAHARSKHDTSRA